MFPGLLNKCLVLKPLGPYLVRYTLSFAYILRPMLPDKRNKRRILWDSKIQSSRSEKKQASLIVRKRAPESMVIYIVIPPPPSRDQCHPSLLVYRVV
jgi:hypothetical protein